MKMNKWTYLTLSVLLLAAGCAPPKEKTKITKEEDGLTCLSIAVLQNGSALEFPVVSIDDTLEMSFAGLSGFRCHGNMVYPGGTLTVKDENGEVLFKLDDVFVDLSDSGAREDLVNKNISMFLETGSPMKSGHRYTWENIIWDRRANRKITGTTVITVE